MIINALITGNEEQFFVKTYPILDEHHHTMPCHFRNLISQADAFFAENRTEECIATIEEIQNYLDNNMACVLGLTANHLNCSDCPVHIVPYDISSVVAIAN